MFTFRTTLELKGAVALYGRFDMRVLRISLSKVWNEPLLDSKMGESVLPAPLLAPSLGEAYGAVTRRRTAANTPLDGSWTEVSDELRLAHTAHVWTGDESDRYRCVAPRVNTVARGVDHFGDVPQWDECDGAFDRPLPAGALPHGLLFLQLTWRHDKPPEVGSIPDTVVSLP